MGSGLVKSVGKAIGSVVSTVGDVVSNAVKNPIATISDIAAIATGQPEIAAIGNAANTASKGGSLGQSLLSGATAYATQAAGTAIGDYAGTSSIGRTVGLDTTVGSLVNDSTTVGPQFFDTGLGNTISARIANSTIGNAIGGAASLALSPAQAKSGSDLNIGSQTVSTAQTNTGTGVTSVTSAPTTADAAPSGDDVARAAAAAAGRNQSILSDQTDEDTVNGNPNILRRKSLLSD